MVCEGVRNEQAGRCVCPGAVGEGEREGLSEGLVCLAGKGLERVYLG